ncbi:Bet v I/Major latex protein [Arabidopsis suecica]|uniref:Bet v I/Major latex protein n=1 Tax=Arabidopsis suecica TaxID=45249 RepID=A0A8T2CFA4_ARASU|nr:Bet v I/Major latex protein [Arabidopsis suecica]
MLRSKQRQRSSITCSLEDHKILQKPLLTSRDVLCMRESLAKLAVSFSGTMLLDGQPKVAKERIEAVDQEKNLIAFRVVDGDMLKGFKSLLITVQATPKLRGSGSVVNCHLKYERIDEEVAHPEKLLALFVKAAKDMDEMLLSQV